MTSTTRPNPLEAGLYRVEYVDLVGNKRMMIARPGEAMRWEGRWLSVWIMAGDQPDTWPGPIRKVIRAERLDA